MLAAKTVEVRKSHALPADDALQMSLRLAMFSSKVDTCETRSDVTFLSCPIRTFPLAVKLSIVYRAGQYKECIIQQSH